MLKITKRPRKSNPKTKLKLFHSSVFINKSFWVLEPICSHFVIFNIFLKSTSCTSISESSSRASIKKCIFSAKIFFPPKILLTQCISIQSIPFPPFLQDFVQKCGLYSTLFLVVPIRVSPYKLLGKLFRVFEVHY